MAGDRTRVDAGIEFGGGVSDSEPAQDGRREPGQVNDSFDAQGCYLRHDTAGGEGQGVKGESGIESGAQDGHLLR